MYWLPFSVALGGLKDPDEPPVLVGFILSLLDVHNRGGLPSTDFWAWEVVQW